MPDLMAALEASIQQGQGAERSRKKKAAPSSSNGSQVVRRARRPPPRSHSRGAGPTSRSRGASSASRTSTRCSIPCRGSPRAQVIDYYTRVAPALLPHLQGRPLTLKRYPNGVEGQYFYEKHCPSHRPDWVQDRARGRHRLLPLRRPADAGVGGQPGRPRAAPLAVAGGADRAPDDDGLRPRPGRAGGDDRVLPGGAVAARGLRCPWPRVLPEDLGLEGAAGLRAAERGGRELRRHQALLAGAGTPPGEPARQARGLEPEEGAAPRQGADRLEPERRAQDHRVRLLPARARAAHRVDAADLGRGRGCEASSDLVFEAGDVLERVQEHGDLFEPVLSLEQTLPDL